MARYRIYDGNNATKPNRKFEAGKLIRRQKKITIAYSESIVKKKYFHAPKERKTTQKFPSVNTSKYRTNLNGAEQNCAVKYDFSRAKIFNGPWLEAVLSDIFFEQTAEAMVIISSTNFLNVAGLFQVCNVAITVSYFSTEQKQSNRCRRKRPQLYSFLVFHFKFTGSLIRRANNSV